jgi:hypothetical protein
LRAVEREIDMAWTVDSALDDDLVEVVDRNDAGGEYVVQIGTLTTLVTISLRRLLNSDDVEFIVSHAIKTPVQAGPYWTSRPFDDDPAYALHRAINGITSYYRQAIQAGHHPREEWLVPRGSWG